MEKKAISQKALGQLVRTLGGAGIGAAVGHEVTPRLFGYTDVPEARRSSAILDAALGAVVGRVGLRNVMRFMRPPAKITNKNIGKAIGKATTPIAALLGGETLPIFQAGLHKSREASQDISNAAKQIATAGKTVSIPHNISKALGSSTARGAGVGAAGAGLAALGTGLLRRQSEREYGSGASRGSMVGGDFLKYLAPAMLAGGVVGSLKKPSSSA